MESRSQLWRNNVHLFLLRSLVGLAFLCLCMPAVAQQFAGQQLSSYIGQNVSSVQIAGQPDVSFDKVADLISVQKGKPLSEREVDATINALEQRGGFKGVRLNLQPEADGVSVIFILQPALYVGMYQFPGATKVFNYSRLLQVTNYNAQTPNSATDVQQAERALVQFFRQHGYFQAEVRPEVVPNPAHGLADVVFHTDLGVLAKFGVINLSGSTPQETAYLQRKLRSVMARLRGASLKTGTHYSYPRLQSATDYMESVLEKQDYLARSVKLIGAEYDPKTNRADITFNVDSGEVIRVRTAGAHLWARTRRNLVPMYDENDVNDELIKQGQQNIASYFQSKGYFDARVDANVSKTANGTSILYEIHKDSRHKVKEVAFQGNHHFTAKELQAHVSVEKARFFNHGKYSDDLVRDSAHNLRDTYRAAGYSQAAVTPHVVRRDGNVDVTFQVVEGPLDVVDSLSIEGNKTLPESDFAPKGLNLGPGKPYSQELVTKDRNQIMARYLTLGYLNAGFRSKAKPVPNQPHHLTVVYSIIEGPQVKTATIITDGRGHTRQSMIDLEVPIKPGEPLSENALLSSESRLYNLGIFDWAEVDPRRAITDQHDEDVVIKVHEAKRNSIVYGFGFQVINRGGSLPSGTVALPGIPGIGLPPNFRTSEKTFWGPDGTFEYTRRNIRGRAETFSLTAFAGRLDQRGALTYTDPYFRGTQWKGSAILSVEHDSQNPIFTSRLGNAGYQLERALNKKKTSNFFLRYNFQLTRISNLIIPELVPPDQLNVRLSTLSASFTHDTRDNPLDAHRGYYASYQLGVSPKWIGSNFSFAQLLMQNAYYKNVHSGIIWANSIRIGLEQGIQGSVVPLSQEFSPGGGSTLAASPLTARAHSVPWSRAAIPTIRRLAPKSRCLTAATSCSS